MLTTVEWNTLEEIAEILKPFEEMTVELSAEKNVTISKVILMTEGVTTAIAKLRRNVSQPKSIDLCNMLEKKLAERFSMTASSFRLAAPTFLDPKFKAKGICISKI